MFRLLLSPKIWEDNIATYSNIYTLCDIRKYDKYKVFKRRTIDASEAEVASELALELSYDKMGYVEVVESQVVDFIDDYANN